MRLVVDADVLIDVFRNVSSAIDLLATAQRDSAELMSVTPVRTEVLRGASPERLRPVLDLLGTLAWIVVDEDLADRAADHGRRYGRSHSGIQVTDLLLAAAVERIDGQLLTRNVRHFPMFPGLRPAY
ncbi:MAG: PIN domain-containing protein [Candidatus Limnocylindria bacterium]